MRGDQEPSEELRLLLVTLLHKMVKLAADHIEPSVRACTRASAREHVLRLRQHAMCPEAATCSMMSLLP